MLTDDTFPGISAYSKNLHFIDFTWLRRKSVATEIDFWFSGTLSPMVVKCMIYPLALMVVEVAIFMY